MTLPKMFDPVRHGLPVDAVYDFADRFTDRRGMSVFGFDCQSCQLVDGWYALRVGSASTSAL